MNQKKVIITGYSVCPFPVFSWYIYLKISSASSVSPHSIKNFGLSGKKNSKHPSNKLGMAQIATNKFQLWNKNQPCFISTERGIISQAIAKNKKKKRF